MTSPDGITWISQTSLNNAWFSVTYENGLFVVVSDSGTGNRYIYSGLIVDNAFEQYIKLLIMIIK